MILVGEIEIKSDKQILKEAEMEVEVIDFIRPLAKAIGKIIAENCDQ